ncbi:hypothetical protein ACYSNW_06585 [Enterococcus sp. LJL99]
MQKSLYIIEGALKNLFRMNGIILNSLLLLVLTFFTFLSFNGFLFFSYWIQWVKSDAMKQDGNVQVASPIVTQLTIFEGMTLVLFGLLVIVSISYLYRMNIQYFKMQQRDYLVMTFIGESNAVLSIEYALQGSFMALVLFSLGDLLATFVFLNRLSATAKLGPFSNVIEGFSPKIMNHIFLIIGIILYIFLRLFFYVKKQLKLFFTDSQRTF